jgi:uncharacterized protein (DUF58 family)
VSTPAATARYGALLDAVRGVRWPARRRVAGAMAGAHPSRAVGTSAEVTEYRLYRQGDDPRRLDWRLLARTDRAFVRVATSTATLPTTFVVDASPSMAFPPEGPTKFAAAAALAVSLAGVAHAQGDPVAVTVVGRETRRLPPRTRRGVVAQIGETLAAAPLDGGAPLAPALLALGGSGRAVLLTDFLGDAEALVRAVAEHAAAGGEVHAVHVVADEELDPPARGLALDPEAPEVRRPLGAAARAEYLTAFASWRETLARDLRAAGASYTLVTPAEAAGHAVRRIVAPAERVGGARQ